MGASKQDAILSWIEGVSRSLQETPLPADGLQILAGDQTTPPPSTSGGQHKRKRDDCEVEFPMPQPDPSKTLRRAESTTASLPPTPLRLKDDASSLAPSISTASRRGRSRSSSPSRVRTELQSATPRIIYLNENQDPGSEAAKQLLTNLMDDSEFIGDQRAMRNICTTSCKHMTALAPESYWVIDVAVPLLKEAIGNLPLTHFIVYVLARVLSCTKLRCL